MDQTRMSGREAGATSDARPGAVSDAVSGRERMGAAVRTPRLVLRRPTTADAAFHHALHSDPAVYAHSPSAREPDPEANARVLQGWIDHWDQEGFGYWVAELASPGGEGPPVGFVGVRRDGDALNLYYRFAPPGARGSVADTDPAATRGLGREAARAAVAWATQWLPQVRVQAVCKQTNAPAVATALSAGLLPDGAQDAGDGSMFGRWVSPRFEVTGGAPGVAGSGPADAAGADGPVELCEEEVAELLDVWERVVRTGDRSASGRTRRGRRSRRRWSVSSPRRGRGSRSSSGCVLPTGGSWGSPGGCAGRGRFSPTSWSCRGSWSIRRSGATISGRCCSPDSTPSRVPSRAWCCCTPNTGPERGSGASTPRTGMPRSGGMRG